MFIDVQHLKNNAIIIKAAGKLDIYNASDYLDTAKKSTNLTKELILDFSQIDYIASIGLRAILELHKIMSEKEGIMKIRNASEEVLYVFKITGFDNFLNIENNSDNL